MSDLVNHPPHYTAHASGVECIELTERLSFCLGNALKYLWRAGLKGGVSSETDLKKSSWYLRRQAAHWESRCILSEASDSKVAELAERVAQHEPVGTFLATFLRLLADESPLPRHSLEMPWLHRRDILQLADLIDAAVTP